MSMYVRVYQGDSGMKSVNVSEDGALDIVVRRSVFNSAMLKRSNFRYWNSNVSLEYETV